MSVSHGYEAVEDICTDSRGCSRGPLRSSPIQLGFLMLYRQAIAVFVV